MNNRKMHVGVSRNIFRLLLLDVMDLWAGVKALLRFA